MSKRKRLVPDKPGWWWRWRKYDTYWWPTYVPSGDIGEDKWVADVYWGGPVTPPKWTPKEVKHGRQ